MTTVLSVGSGSAERKCTATCHNARQPGCDCVCGGAYHGKGSAQVIVQVQQDIATGVFGEVVPVDRPRQAEYHRERHPETVRFHRREVARATRRLGQLALEDEEQKPRPARVSGTGSAPARGGGRTAHG